ncbi:MAG: glycosyltransferase family 2 protein [Chloroflexi bacterium]|nr:MAG: glycosyltransferase family 2 protein [Chloroflexota bacterium]
MEDWMGKVSVIILTKDEEDNIADCIHSASWADEVIVLDSGSTDRTVEIAGGMGARIFTHPFRNYAEQRNVALGLAQTEWVFFVDADERVTPELAEEIKQVIEDENYVGWWVPRQNYIAGKWIRYGGWYPDYQLRLLQPDKAHYDPVWEVHEIVILDGKAGYLRHHLIHYNYRDWREFVTRQKNYAPLEAGVLEKRGIHPKPWSPISMPVREFYRRYVTLKGYRDGFHGLLLATLMAFYTMYVYTLLLSKTTVKGK